MRPHLVAGAPTRWAATGLVAYRLSRRVRNRVFTAVVRGGFAELGASSSITPPVTIDGAAHVRIGRGVALGPHCALLVGGTPAPDEIRISIGDRVSVVGFCTISSFLSITIGDGALFARGVYISDHKHAYTDPSRPIRDQGVTGLRPVRIGNGAWLGENVIILPGVHVGDGAVVGANSVVRSDVPAFSLAMGSPARVIRSWAPTSPIEEIEEMS